MLYEFRGVCQHCACEVSTTVHNGVLLNVCKECKDAPFDLKQYKGLVYILRNKNQPGVKIGKTTGTVEKRAKQLGQNTGVPGKFDIMAIFPTNRPDKDEKKVHDKLASLSWTFFSSLSGLLVGNIAIISNFPGTPVF